MKDRETQQQQNRSNLRLSSGDNTPIQHYNFQNGGGCHQNVFGVNELPVQTLNMPADVRKC